MSETLAYKKLTKNLQIFVISSDTQKGVKMKLKIFNRITTKTKKINKKHPRFKISYFFETLTLLYGLWCCILINYRLFLLFYIF